MADRNQKTSKKIIEINKYSYDKTDEGRRIQLTAFFHMLKLRLGDDAYTEMTSTKKVCYIPFSFNIYETIAMAKYLRPLTWYVELDENNYAEIRSEEITVNGTKDFLKTVSDAFTDGESYTSDYDVFLHDFAKAGNNWTWNNFTKNIYERILGIGNTFLKNGNVMIYPVEDVEEDEFHIYDKAGFTRLPLTSIEYIALRSNIENGKMVLIDCLRNTVLATGFNELEKEELKDYLV